MPLVGEDLREPVLLLLCEQRSAGAGDASDAVERVPGTATMPQGLLLDALPALVRAALEMILALVEGLMEALPQLIEMVPEILNAIIDTIIELLPVIVEMAPETFVGLAVGRLDWSGATLSASGVHAGEAARAFPLVR